MIAAVLGDTSKYPSWKVNAEGSGTVTITSGNTVGYTQTAHSLGYRPFVIVFSEFVDSDSLGAGVSNPGIYYQHDWRIDGATVTFEGYTKIYANKIDIFVGMGNNARPGVVNGIYYIFKDEL